MSILLDNNTKVLIQGMTGKEGQKAAAAMMDYGTHVLCGVTPGKGGQEVEGKAIFNSVAEAVSQFSDITVSAIYAPPFATKAAALEAIDAGIPFVYIFAERVPIQDTAHILAAAHERGTRILGPSSMGCIVPGVVRLGLIGGPKEQADQIYTPGSIGIISRSGGMTNEVSWQIRKNGMGQSTAVHVGGDLLMGTTYADLLRLFEKDEQTKAVVLYGEHGGSYEFEVVEMMKKKEFTKPLAIFIGGKFTSSLPEGMNIGHAGAIVARGQGAAEKEAALREVGVMIADTYEDLITLIKPFA
jgi:succinyl-CoA synthetase alpha subunit